MPVFVEHKMGNNELLESQPPYKTIPHEVGLGLIALKDFRAGEVISPLYWDKRKSSPSRWTVQCGDEEHADPMPFDLRYINHSCQPNVIFDVDGEVVRALSDIKSGEEFQFFYPATEWQMDEPFDCKCGQPNCLGRITGAANLSPEVMVNYELTSIISRKLAGRTQYAKAAHA